MYRIKHLTEKNSKNKKSKAAIDRRNGTAIQLGKMKKL